MSTARRVMLIDDDPVTLLTIGTRLRAVGYEVIAHEGSMGVMAVAARLRPDIAILDVNMPGISGRGVAELLRDLDPEPLLVLYSSTPEPELETIATDVGATGFATKSAAGPDNLVVELRRVLLEHRGRISTAPRPPVPEPG